tara:strand:+ start:4277 stop:4780 length:504 start_codon:yes stop_codon:yes gene_type:complete
MGFGHVTIEAVAALSGVGKPTIYRHWSNAGELVMEALMSDLPESSSARQDDVIATLRSQLQRLVETFATTRGRQITMALAASDPESEMTKAFRHRVILSSRERGRDMIAAAVKRGEIAAPADVEVILDMIYAPLFFRLLVGHLPLDQAFSDNLGEQVEAMLTLPYTQ